MQSGLIPGNFIVSFLKYFLIGLCLFCQINSANSQELTAENNIKAAYLYKLSQFIYWPERLKADNNKISLCIFGDTIYRAATAIFEDNQDYQKSHTIIRILPADMNISKCDLFYLDSNHLASVSKFSLPKIRDQIVTISDVNHFLFQGGMIELANRSGRIRMLINMREVKKSKIKLSAKLMEVGELRW
jgi:hypothetical protein